MCDMLVRVTACNCSVMTPLPQEILKGCIASMTGLETTITTEYLLLSSVTTSIHGVPSTFAGSMLTLNLDLQLTRSSVFGRSQARYLRVDS